MAQSEQWLTSFYFQQDLRSYYMNNILSATIRPGIYNANIGIGAYDSTSGSSDKLGDGLNLFIKKGTTFVFSNSYIANEESRFERDLSTIGTYLIKSVALEDIEVSVVYGSQEQNYKKILGTSSSLEAERFFIIARMEYDPSTAISGSEGETPKFFGFTCSTEGFDNITAISLPELHSVSAVSTETRVSYLIVGEVSFKGDRSYYIKSDSVAWRESSSSASTWNNKHVFFGRSFPDYRHTMLSETSNLNSEILFDIKNTEGETSISKLRVDLKPSLLNGKIVSSESNWRNLCGLSNYYTDGNSLSIKTYKVDDLKAFDKGQNYVITDFIYLSDNLKDSSREEELQEIYSSSSTKSPNIKTYSWVSKITTEDFNSLDPKSNNSDYITNSLTSGDSIGDNEGKFVSNMIPLDVSALNQERLLSLVKNKNIVSGVINKIRRDGDNSGSSISDAKMDTIIPVAMIFRGFRPELNGTSITYSDTISDGSNYNPANVLSFFDLQYGSHKLNVLNANVDDVYNVLSVVE